MRSFSRGASSPIGRHRRRGEVRDAGVYHRAAIRSPETRLKFGASGCVVGRNVIRDVGATLERRPLACTFVASSREARTLDEQGGSTPTTQPATLQSRAKQSRAKPCPGSPAAYSQRGVGALRAARCRADQARRVTFNLHESLKPLEFSSIESSSHDPRHPVHPGADGSAAGNPGGDGEAADRAPVRRLQGARAPDREEARAGVRDRATRRCSRPVRRRR